MNFFPSPFAPENLVSRDRFGIPVPRQPAARSPQSGSIWCLLTRIIWTTPTFRDEGVHLFIITLSVIGSVPSLSGHITVRTDSVCCRESAGAESVVLKVVRVTGAAFPAITVDQFFHITTTIRSSYQQTTWLPILLVVN